MSQDNTAAQSDHDLLIVLSTKLDFLIAALSGKADQHEVAELRDKIHEIEKAQEKLNEFRWRVVGFSMCAAGVISVIARYLLGGH